LANIASARKRARQNEKRRKQNASQKTLLRSRIRKVISAADAGDKEAALTAYQQAVPLIDRMANKHLIHKNKAARHKHQLNARLKALQARA